jgi:hypothetical protein
MEQEDQFFAPSLDARYRFRLGDIRQARVEIEKVRPQPSFVDQYNR